MGLYFTSDQHFGHKNIITYETRPWRDVDEMTTGLIANYNSVISDDDTVYFVGDFTLQFRYAAAVLPKLKGNKQLYMGNHDSCHPAFKFKDKTATVQQYLDIGFTKVALSKSLVLANGKRAFVTHVPYDDMRYPHFAAVRGEEDILIHGHVHSAWRLKYYKNIPMFNVGVDVNNYFPISEEELISTVWPS